MGAYCPYLLVSPCKSDADDKEPCSVSDCWLPGYKFCTRKRTTKQRRRFWGQIADLFGKTKRLLFENDLAGNTCTLTSLQSF